MEATIHIRRLEEGKKKSIIVALTAGDCEKNELKKQYMSLGFDELEGKPFSKKSFRTFLNKYFEMQY